MELLLYRKLSHSLQVLFFFQRTKIFPASRCPSLFTCPSLIPYPPLQQPSMFSFNSSFKSHPQEGLSWPLPLKDISPFKLYPCILSVIYSAHQSLKLLVICLFKCVWSPPVDCNILVDNNHAYLIGHLILCPNVFIHFILIKGLLYAKYFSRYSRYNNGTNTNPCLCAAYNLVWNIKITN